MNIYKIVFENKFTPSRFYKSEKIARQDYACFTLAKIQCDLVEVALADDYQVSYIDDEILVSGIIHHSVSKQQELSGVSAGFLGDYDDMRKEIAQYGDTHVNFCSSSGFITSFFAVINISKFKNESSSYDTEKIEQYICDEYVKWRKENVQD